MNITAILWVAAALAAGSPAAAAQGDAPYLLPGPGLSVFCQDGSVQFFDGGVRVRSCVVSRDVNLRDTNNAPTVCQAGMTATFNERGYLLECRAASPVGGTPSGSVFGPAQTQPPQPPPADPNPGGLFGPVRAGPIYNGGTAWSDVCQSAMTAILRAHQKSFGPQAMVRVAWVRAFTYENGDCMGGFRVMVKRPGDVSEWIALEWNADFGMGRIAARDLVQQYQRDNPDLPWGPSSGTPAGTMSVNAAGDRDAICRSAMVAMEREKQAQWGSDGRVRYEWVKPLTFDNGDCVGGYKIMIKRPADTNEFSSLEWFADRGNGRVPVSQLVAQYQQKYPDLTWTPAPAR